MHEILKNSINYKKKQKNYHYLNNQYGISTYKVIPFKNMNIIYKIANKISKHFTGNIKNNLFTVNGKKYKIIVKRKNSNILPNLYYIVNEKNKYISAISKRRNPEEYRKQIINAAFNIFMETKTK